MRCRTSLPKLRIFRVNLKTKRLEWVKSRNSCKSIRTLSLSKSPITTWSMTLKRTRSYRVKSTTASTISRRNSFKTSPRSMLFSSTLKAKAQRVTISISSKTAWHFATRSTWISSRSAWAWHECTLAAIAPRYINIRLKLYYWYMW